MIREYQPAVLTLDIYLPDMQGWRVLERLKADLATRHIPVCVISTDESRERALKSGALAFIAKPIQTRDTLDALGTGSASGTCGPCCSCRSGRPRGTGIVTGLHQRNSVPVTRGDTAWSSELVPDGRDGTAPIKRVGQPPVRTQRAR